MASFLPAYPHKLSVSLRQQLSDSSLPHSVYTTYISFISNKNFFHKFCLSLKMRNFNFFFCVSLQIIYRVAYIGTCTSSRLLYTMEERESGEGQSIFPPAAAHRGASFPPRSRGGSTCCFFLDDGDGLVAAGGGAKLQVTSTLRELSLSGQAQP